MTTNDLVCQEKQPTPGSFCGLDDRLVNRILPLNDHAELDTDSASEIKGTTRKERLSLIIYFKKVFGLGGWLPMVLSSANNQ
jgi:hypothetical protein